MIPAPAAGLLLAAAAALLLGLVLVRLDIERLRIENYRGVQLPVVGGIVVAGGVAFASAIALDAGLGSPGMSDRQVVGCLLLAGGFFLLGLMDDLLGDGSSRGLGGHLKALVRGRVTTGAVKAVGGGALALGVGLWWEQGNVGAALLDGLVIALAANLVNLLDLRPGRAAKGYFVLSLPAAVAAWSAPILPVLAITSGAVAGWVSLDLREKGTLGDSGANMIGAVAGGAMAAGAPPEGRAVALIVLLGLTLASERMSFSEVIERTGPLRWMDGLGRLRLR